MMIRAARIRLLRSGISATIAAAPLDPAPAPANAKQVIPVDFETLRNTALTKPLCEQRPQTVQAAQEWLREQYGIAPRGGLKGETAFGDSNEEHSASRFCWPLRVAQTEAWANLTILW